jgi:hypothetical protein
VLASAAAVGNAVFVEVVKHQPDTALFDLRTVLFGMDSILRVTPAPKVPRC